MYIAKITECSALPPVLRLLQCNSLHRLPTTGLLLFHTTLSRHPLPMMLHRRCRLSAEAAIPHDVLALLCRVHSRPVQKVWCDCSPSPCPTLGLSSQRKPALCSSWSCGHAAILSACYTESAGFFRLRLPYHNRPCLCFAGFTAGLCKGLARLLFRVLYHWRPCFSEEASTVLLCTCFCTPCLPLSRAYVYSGSLASRASTAACIPAYV